MIEVTIPEAERRMEELLHRVERGEEVLILDDGKPRARLRALTAEERARPSDEPPP